MSVLKISPPRTFKVGDPASIYIGDHKGKRTPGIVVAVLNLEGWLFPHYVIECEVGAPDPILEVRSGYTAMRPETENAKDSCES